MGQSQCPLQGKEAALNHFLLLKSLKHILKIQKYKISVMDVQEVNTTSLLSQCTITWYNNEKQGRMKKQTAVCWLFFFCWFFFGWLVLFLNIS